MSIRKRVTFAERWLRDIMHCMPAPGFFIANEIDMTQVQDMLKQFKAQDRHITYSHVIIRATALALKHIGDDFCLVSDTQRLTPDSVDIGISVAGDDFIAPVLIIKDAETKPISVIAKEVDARIDGVREQDKTAKAQLSKWGWLVPFGFIRRFILRRIIRNLNFRFMNMGAFQITGLHNADIFVPFLFGTTAVLGMGRVADRPAVRNGELCVAPTVKISVCVDHKVWDGARAAHFLSALEYVLTHDNLKEYLETKNVLTIKKQRSWM